MAPKKSFKKFGGTPPTLDLDGVVRLMEQCEPESDRGVALLVGAYLDNALELAIRRCLPEDELADEVSLFDERVLGTFSAKIKMARALGLLSPEIYADLELIRGIRNDFAHYPDELTFDTQSVRDRCKNTTVEKNRARRSESVSGSPAEDAVPRLTFVRAAGMAIAAVMLQTRLRQRPPKPVPLEMVVKARPKVKTE